MREIAHHAWVDRGEGAREEADEPSGTLRPPVPAERRLSCAPARASVAEADGGGTPSRAKGNGDAAPLLCVGRPSRERGP